LQFKLTSFNRISVEFIKNKTGAGSIFSM